MFLNYIKIGTRYLSKNLSHSFSGLLGLVVGFSAIILMGLYLWNEHSVDRFHKDSERIYRIVQVITTEDGGEKKVAAIAARIGKDLPNYSNDIEEITNLGVFGRLTVGNDLNRRDYETMNVADSNFLTFFNYPLAYGNPVKALSDTNGILFTRAAAEKYVGKEQALGEIVYTDDRDLTVSGVMEEFPQNSHLNIDMIITEPAVFTMFDSWRSFVSTDWDSNNFATYVKLKPGADPEKVALAIAEMVKPNIPEGEFKSRFYLQPLHDIYLNSNDIEGASYAKGNKPFYLDLLLSVAVLLLLIAIFNYANLQTASSVKRIKEVGLRKTIGAARIELFAQFCSESLILALLALIVSFGVVQFVLPSINDLLDRHLSLSDVPFYFYLAVLGMVLLVGILSSIYPFFIITKITPNQALKGDFKLMGGLKVRQYLVVAQFAISMLIISGTFVIYKQMQYLREKELGFDLDNMMVMDINSGNLRRNQAAIITELKGLSGVQSVTTTSRVPGEWKSFFKVDLKVDAIKSNAVFIGADENFLETYKIKLQEGRNFSGKESDSAYVLLNRKAVANLGLSDPIGAVINIPTSYIGGGEFPLETPYNVTVIGVVEDFFFESFREDLAPMVIAFRNNPVQGIDYFTLRLNTGDWTNTLASIKEINYKYDAENPVEYHFLDSQFERFFKEDEARGKIFASFAFMAILVSCIGLWALASYMVRNRTKEVGIRKVLGAELFQVVRLLSTDFVKLVIWAVIVAIPFVYYFSQIWLRDFSYKIDMPWTLFLFSGLLLLITSIGTVAYITYQAASANPVNSLKDQQ